MTLPHLPVSHKGLDSMKDETLQDRLQRWGYSQEVNERIRPILEIAEQGRLIDFEISFCKFALQIIEDVEAGNRTPNEANNLFLLVDLYITEKEIEDNISDEIQELVMEGLHFHHLGDDWKPDVVRMRSLIEKHLNS